MKSEIKGYLFRTEKSPSYQAKILVPGRKPLYKSTGERNQRAALARLDKMIESVKASLGMSGNATIGVTISEFCRIPDPHHPDDTGGLYVRYIRNNRAGTTCDRYLDILRTQIVPRLGAYRLDDITPSMVEAWKQVRLGQKKTRGKKGMPIERATVKKELDVLSNVFKIARIVYGLTTINPVRDIERPKVPKKKKRIPSPVEIARFFHVCALHRPNHLPPLLTLYLTGARVDEVRHLEPKDVRLTDGQLAFCVKPGWHPKDMEDRCVPLVEPLLSVIVTVLAEHSGSKWLFERKDGRTIFCRRCGNHETHFGNMRKTILTIARIAEVPSHVTHHILRHCCNTHGQKLGALTVEMMEILGQTDSSVNRLYTHADWEGMVAAIRRLGQTIGTDWLGSWLGTLRSSDASQEEASNPCDCTSSSD